MVPGRVRGGVVVLSRSCRAGGRVRRALGTHNEHATARQPHSIQNREFRRGRMQAPSWFPSAYAKCSNWSAHSNQAAKSGSRRWIGHHHMTRPRVARRRTLEPLEAVRRMCWWQFGRSWNPAWSTCLVGSSRPSSLTPWPNGWTAPSDESNRI